MELNWFFFKLWNYSKVFLQQDSLMHPTSARCCSEIKYSVLEKPNACSHLFPLPLSHLCSLSFFGFAITESKRIEWVATWEQLQMPQCQHTWLQAILLVWWWRPKWIGRCMSQSSGGVQWFVCLQKCEDNHLMGSNDCGCNFRIKLFLKQFKTARTRLGSIIKFF